MSKNSIEKVMFLTFEQIKWALKEGRRVQIRNFGVWSVRIAGARVGRDPRTGTDEVTIPRRRVVRFKPTSRLKLNK